jgi:uncharacterized FlaG/YvyC family protein
MKVQSQVQPAAAARPAARPTPQVAPRPAAPPPPQPEFRPQPVLKQDPSDDLLRAAQELRDALGPMFNTAPQFSVDTETHRVRIEIVDGSGEIVRQIPSEAVERFARSFDRFLGMLVDEQA